jgi:XTP/dITP diphosphohydrolase
MKLIFATNNRHKADEIKPLVGSQFEILTLKEARIDIDIPEPHETLKENASEKSRTVHRLTGLNCFSEDTGLEVDILNGEPGVRSARYAGDEKSFQKNIDKLLLKLRGQSNRRARFKTVVSLIFDNKEYFFEGVCKGRITEEQRGNNGFGYDSVFVPDGETHTFAELGLAEKNKFSHRQKAIASLLSFLRVQ